MAVMRSFCDALKQAGAAKETAGYENRLANLKRDLTLLKWMLASNIALNLAIIARLFLSRIE